MITPDGPPSSDFNHPLGLLQDCHRRIERFLSQLIVAIEQSPGGRLTSESRAWLEQALRYFEKAAPLHTDDEEESLFPRLRATGAPEAIALLETIGALEADHDRADELHAEVDGLGQVWLQSGHLPEEKIQRLLELLCDLRKLYERHIAMEDRQVFPTAGRVLEAADIRELGREMAQRRGLDPGAVGPVSRCSVRRLSTSR